LHPKPPELIIDEWYGRIGRKDMDDIIMRHLSIKSVKSWMVHLFEGTMERTLDGRRLLSETKFCRNASTPLVVIDYFCHLYEKNVTERGRYGTD
jgi:hypothetical protein